MRGPLRFMLGAPPRTILLGTFMPEVREYLARVEDADSARLETPVLNVMGTLAQYRIPLLGGAVFMAGARTLPGALVPMVGPAPTQSNLIGADYTRLQGVKFNGINKVVSTNVVGSTLQQDNHHMGVGISIAPTITGRIGIGHGGSSAGALNIAVPGGLVTQVSYRSRSSASRNLTVTAPEWVDFHGLSRSNSSEYEYRSGSQSITFAQVSSAAATGTISVGADSGGSFFSDAGIRFYTLGTSIDLAEMRTRFNVAVSSLAALGI
jgi:hypothetical protein